MSGFKCSISSSDLCFNGGVCSSDICSCANNPSFIHDFSMLHDPNCTLHKDAYLAIVIISCIVSLFSAGILIPGYLKSKSLVKQMLHLNFGLLVWLFCLALSLYFQSGFYEAAIVCLGIVCFDLYKYMVNRTGMGILDVMDIHSF